MRGRPIGSGLNGVDAGEWYIKRLNSSYEEFLARIDNAETGGCSRDVG